MNIIVLGDSIAWGAFDEQKGGWVERLKTHLFKHDCFVYNCSVSGDTSKDLLCRMAIEIKARKDENEETGIIIAIGANDCGFDNTKKIVATLPEYYDNIKEIYNYAKSHTKNILFVGLTPVDDKRSQPVHWDENLNYNTAHTKQYNDALKQFCDNNKIMYVSLIDLKAYDFVDGVHPNEAVHEQIFLRVKDKIKNWYN